MKFFLFLVNLKKNLKFILPAANSAPLNPNNPCSISGFKNSLPLCCNSVASPVEEIHPTNAAVDRTGLAKVKAEKTKTPLF